MNNSQNQAKSMESGFDRQRPCMGQCDVHVKREDFTYIIAIHCGSDVKRGLFNMGPNYTQFMVSIIIIPCTQMTINY